ncbi:MAG: ubiquitin-like small modifier protein 1 [Longimicrobiales bacterium]|nr:ubiquitin-like small modifier protein 1 [Longimicrobiales bacterium]
MAITVRVPNALRKLTGNEGRLQSEGSNVREVLENVGEEHPDFLARITEDDGELRQFLNVFVNGNDIRFEDELDTPVSDGDEISIVPSIAGG